MSVITATDGKKYKTAKSIQTGDQIMVRQQFRSSPKTVTDVTSLPYLKDRVAIVIGDSTRTFDADDLVQVKGD